LPLITWFFEPYPWDSPGKSDLICHPERREGTQGILRAEALRMTIQGVFIASFYVILSKAKNLRGFFGLKPSE